MNGISFATKLEIYCNPNDLAISVARDEKTGTYALSVCRGPGHNGKLLLTSAPFVAETSDLAAEEVVCILDSIRTSIGDVLVNTSSLFDTDETEDKTNAVLSEQLISWIRAELKLHGEAQTFKIVTVESERLI